MESININELWLQHEHKLTRQIELNSKAIKQQYISEAKNHIKGIWLFPVIALLFYLATASYSLYFIIQNLNQWYFIGAGFTVFIFSVLFIHSSTLQLKGIINIDYNLPIIDLQKRLLDTQLSFIRNIKIAVWIIPFGPLVGVFFMKSLFGFDLVQLWGEKMLFGFSITTLMLEIIAWYLSRKLNTRTIPSWLKWLMKGNGSQFEEAIKLLEEIKEVEECHSSKA
tara:strand:+ start:1171 stop:1842 length:672 start_codon:yes stop_codon:yes gene_type:complete